MELVNKPKKVPTKEFTIFQPEEIEPLISAARPKWLGDMILLAYNTGMRKEEVVGLQWGDIDFKTCCLRVNHTIVAVAPHKYFISEPKTKTSRREILFGDEVLEMLMRRKKKSNSEWVFENQYNKEIDPWYIVKYFRNSCVKAGIPIRRFHDLRHTHITELIIAGIAIPVVQSRAGHSDIRMTMRYTHTLLYMQQPIVDLQNNRKNASKGGDK